MGELSKLTAEQKPFIMNSRKRHCLCWYLMVLMQGAFFRHHFKLWRSIQLACPPVAHATPNWAWAVTVRLLRYAAVSDFDSFSLLFSDSLLSVPCMKVPLSKRQTEAARLHLLFHSTHPNRSISPGSVVLSFA